MNKSETYETITDLTLLVNRLRRRRDEWKHRADINDRKVKAVEAKCRTAEWMNSVYSECMDNLNKENAKLCAEIADLRAALLKDATIEG